MKHKILTSILFIAAFSLVNACMESEPELANTKPATFTMKINATTDASVRTAIGADNAVIWTSGDNLGVYQIANGQIAHQKRSENLTADTDKATFSVSLDAVEASEYLYAAVYPGTAVRLDADTTFAAFGSEFVAANEVRNFGPEFTDSVYVNPSSATELLRVNYQVTIPTTQKPTATSFDPKADVLIAENIMTSIQPTELNMVFHRFGATAKMTISGMTPGETVMQVDFYTPETNICGRSHFNTVHGTIYDKGYEPYGSTLHIVPAATMTTTGSDVFWMRTIADTLSESFTILVLTDKAYYCKTIDLKASGRTLALAEGGLTEFTVSGLARHAEVADLVLGDSCKVTTSHLLFQEKAANAKTEGDPKFLVDRNVDTRFGMVRPGKKGRLSDGTTMELSKTDTLWFCLDLGTPKTVSAFRVVNRPKSVGLQIRLRAFDKILGSNDGVSWDVIAKDVMIYNTLNVEKTVNQPLPPSTCRYYKFVIQSQRCFNNGKYTSNGGTWQMRELYLAD